MTNDAIEPYRGFLKPTTTHPYALHRDGLGAGDWLAAGVWGAVFLEAFLEELMQARGLPGTERELGGMINRLRHEKSLPNATDVLNHCEMVRGARNALVHAGASPGQVVQTHAATIAGNLPHILRLARPWFPNAPVTSGTDPSYPTPHACVFLSTITPHLEVQDLFLSNLEHALRSRHVEPVRMVLDEYDQRDPVRKMIATLRDCNGLLCVGLERSHAYLLCEREGSSKARETVHSFYSSGWLNLEAGAAFALGLPVFVLCQSRIVSDGVFDRDWNSAPPYIMDGTFPSVDDPAVQRCLNRLVGMMLGRGLPTAIAGNDREN